MIVMGMLLGQHAPRIGLIDLTFAGELEIISFMGRVGVLFLLFYLGLEFSIGRLVKSGKKILVAGTIHVGISLLCGFGFGFLMDWPLKEVLVAAGAMTVTSSAIIAKVLVDLKRTANPETELILGIVMADDIFLAVYLSIVMANLGVAGGLMPVLQPFSALYVLVLAVAGPLLAKHSPGIYHLLSKLFKWQKPRPRRKITIPAAPAEGKH